MRALRPLVIAAGLLAAWALLVAVTQVQPYILPGPLLVVQALYDHGAVIAGHFLVTAAEILLGLACGTLLGVASALVMGLFGPARRWYARSWRTARWC